MSQFRNNSQLQFTDIIELDDSVATNHNSTPEVICLDDSASRSTADIQAENVTDFHRLRAEVDLTNELTRIRDYSDKIVTIPATNIQTKRKADNDVEAFRPAKSWKANQCPALEETVIIEDDSFVCPVPESPSANESNTSAAATPSTSRSDFCSLDTSYIQAVADACIASLSEKYKPKAQFTPYQSLLKGCAVTRELLTQVDTDPVHESRSSEKMKGEKSVNVENKSKDAECILIESESEDSDNSQGPLKNNNVTNGFSSTTESRTKDNVVLETRPNNYHLNNNSCDSNGDILLLDKIPLASSKRVNSKKEVVITIDDNKIEKEKSDALNIGKNVSLPAETVTWKGLRPVIIDGSNVAFSHGLSTLGEKKFSCKGIEICINYFKDRGHKVIAFVPLFRKSNSFTVQSELLGKLAEQGHITFTPSRRVNSRLSVPYDDRYIVQTAVALGGVIVSSDNYRDLLEENEAWRSTIENRLLMFTFVGDMLIFPQDPLGRSGPSLDEFLRFPE